jgi:multiple sugar transport system permease protein
MAAQTRTLTTVVQPARKIRRRVIVRTAILFAALLFLAVPFGVPALWMVATSLKTLDQAMRFPPEWIPIPFMFSNYPRALYEVVPLWHYFINNILYAVPATFADVFSSALVAYGFSKFRARYRRVLFIILISTMLIPYPVIMIPQFVMFQRFGWIDTYLPLIVPSLFGSAFLIFLMRQFMQGISNEIIDAARIDGASVIGLFVRIILPMARSALIAAGILAFSYHWNNYLGPLLFLNSSEKFTLQLGLVHFIAHRGVSHWELLMAASVMAVIPVIILFFTAQRYFIQGIVVTGVK